MGDGSKEKGRLLAGMECLVDEAKSAAESLGENIRDAVEGVISARDNVVMVRVNRESLARLNDLVEAGVSKSRSEAAAYLIGEGIKARQGLFETIADKIDEIRRAKEELRQLLEDREGPPSPS